MLRPIFDWFWLLCGRSYALNDVGAYLTGSGCSWDLVKATDLSAQDKTVDDDFTIDVTDDVDSGAQERVRIAATDLTEIVIESYIF